MGGIQVDKVEGNNAWMNGKMIEVEPEKRATSSRLRCLYYYAMLDKKQRELSEIRKLIENSMEDGEFFSQGQFAGVTKNMLNSGELESVDRGIYRAGPKFDRKASAYIERTPIFLSLPDSAVPERPEEKTAVGGFQKKRGELLNKLEKSMEAIRDEVNGVTVSELADEDFTFIRDFRQLDKIIQDFRNKYQSNRKE